MNKTWPYTNLQPKGVLQSIFINLLTAIVEDLVGGGLIILQTADILLVLKI